MSTKSEIPFEFWDVTRLHKDSSWIVLYRNNYSECCPHFGLPKISYFKTRFLDFHKLAFWNNTIFVHNRQFQVMHWLEPLKENPSPRMSPKPKNFHAEYPMNEIPIHNKRQRWSTYRGTRQWEVLPLFVRYVVLNSRVKTESLHTVYNILIPVPILVKLTYDIVRGNFKKTNALLTSDILVKETTHLKLVLPLGRSLASEIVDGPNPIG